ncbi:hypothetical protein JGU66_08160 [Myxococcaceae bacterium JPH2]|nr:hypothetical protein [Myxococcaceae bacterium JPH2]
MTLLMLPLAAGAHDPISSTQRGMANESGGDNVGEAPSNRAGAIPEVDFGPTSGAGIHSRPIHPDEARMKRISGRVVDQHGQTLYVDREGVVVPLDLSALQMKKQPDKGQEVVATYQVENKTDNVALSLAGEVPQP